MKAFADWEKSHREFVKTINVTYQCLPRHGDVGFGRALLVATTLGDLTELLEKLFKASEELPQVPDFTSARSDVLTYTSLLRKDVLQKFLTTARLLGAIDESVNAPSPSYAWKLSKQTKR